MSARKKATKKKATKKRAAKKRAASKRTVRMGGRATAVGVGYEAKVAAYIATKMLGGDTCVAWKGITGRDITSITMQDIEPVDDVVVTLRGDSMHKVFISAKHRLGAIALSQKSPAFTEVTQSFVDQYRKLSPAQRAGSRLMWAVPSSSGIKMTQHLRKALDNLRSETGTSFEDFVSRRARTEGDAITTFCNQVKVAWESVDTQRATDAQLMELLRMTEVGVYDFTPGDYHEQQAEETIRGCIAKNPEDSSKIWEKLELHFNNANRHGLQTNAASLRESLASSGIVLKSAPSFSTEIELLQHLTTQNLIRLRDHTLLRFPEDEIHIPRGEELDALTSAVKNGHLLITGSPGCGKSGLIHPLVKRLERDRIPVVLLLAEEVFGKEWKGAANLPGLTHTLDEVLSNWPDGSKGVLVTDALDAVRDVSSQRLLRRLLSDVQQGDSKWTVVASVREFDLKYGSELREAFPGQGVSGHSSDEFSGVSHFQVGGLAESKLDHLCELVPEVGPFITRARDNPRSEGVHRSPFFLRLAAGLIRDGVPPERLADWGSPAILLRKFWNARVSDGPGSAHRKHALQSICSHMTAQRTIAITTQEILLGPDDIDATNELRSRGILRSPILRHGMPAGEDSLRFSHHLLHDYAVARSIIPAEASRFVHFIVRQPLLAIFYRQSFLFALEELWDGPDGRDAFWKCALEMEDIPSLHGVTRILAPILAARRVATFTDLEPLFAILEVADDEGSAAEKALKHLASGLQDADEDAISSGAGAWCTLASRLSIILAKQPSVQGPLVHILARLNPLSSKLDEDQSRDLGQAARAILAQHVASEVSKGWRYACLTAIESICRTFDAAAPENEEALTSLLAPERLAQFPHSDLFDLAHQIKHLGKQGDRVVLSLFTAAFSTEPNSNEWEDFGSAILPMRMQSSDNWNSIHYSLADYYHTRTRSNPSLMTALACIAWNSTVRRRSRDTEIATIHFRGVDCPIVEDHGHIADRVHEHEENRILSHFESLLDDWAGASDLRALNSSLDTFAQWNRSSLVWQVFLEAGAKYPETLGHLLEPVLTETRFLTHPDYSYGGIALLASLHSAGDESRRQRLEELIIALPDSALASECDRNEHFPKWVHHCQDKLLGALAEPHLVTTSIQELRSLRAAEEPLPSNRQPEGPRVTSRTISEEEWLEHDGIDLGNPSNKELFRLQNELRTFGTSGESEVSAEQYEEDWHLIEESEQAVLQNRSEHPKMADHLWGHLVSLCESIVRNADWPTTSPRWATLRRILLAAATHPSPKPAKDEDAEEDRWPSWGSPAPRLDCARALPFLAHRLGGSDPEIKIALRKLVRDDSYALRFNLARVLFTLRSVDSELMWELIDYLIREENKFSVLEMVVDSLGRLWEQSVGEVKSRLQLIAARANSDGPVKHSIHKHIASEYLFRFLRQGDDECKAYIDSLIEVCDREPASSALLGQLHHCRAGDWLTLGDALTPVHREESMRQRTWAFFSELLGSAQEKLERHRASWNDLHAAGNTEADEAKFIQESMQCSAHLVDAIAMQLFFASGAHAEKQSKDEDLLTEPQMRRFWAESKELFDQLASEIHPHTAYHLVKTFYHLIPCAPSEVFLAASKAIVSSSTVGYQHESLAVDGVVKLIQRAIADHREIFHSIDGADPEALVALLRVLDLFVEAGWPQARQLTHRFEEIYR